jgi:intein/homing endonuclease
MGNPSLSVEKAGLLAKFIGDGFVCRRYAGYANTDPELLQFFEEKVKQAYGADVYVADVRFTSSNALGKYIYRRHIIRDLLAYLPSFRSGDVFVPAEVFSSSREVKSAFLQSLFDDEGSPSIRSYQKTGEIKRSISISSKSVRLMYGVRTLLGEFGISTNRPSTYTTRQGFTQHYLQITGGHPVARNFILFKKQIGFFSTRKRAILDRIISSYKRAIIT